MMMFAKVAMAMATIQINQVRLKFQIKNAVTGTKNFFVISRHILILLIVIPFEYYFISLTVAAWQIASRELNGSSFTAPMNHHELYQSSSSSIVIIFFSIFVSSFEFKCLSFLFHPVLMCRGVRNVFRLIHLPA